MNVTWTLGFPSGHETGEYLTIDLGGTKLRVCWIVLKGREADTEINQKVYQLPAEVKTGDAEALWTLVVDSLEDFISSHHLQKDPANPLSLGFTFSYPASQDYIDHGRLQTWTKGFDIKGVEGEDAASQLCEAMAKRVSALDALRMNQADNQFRISPFV